MNAYQLKHFQRDFTEKELVSGLELALAEPKDDIVHSVNDGYTKRELTSGPDDDIIELNGRWEEHDNIGGIRCEVWLDRAHGELVRNYCSCSCFVKSGYACEHVTALLAEYLMKQDGAESLRKSMLAEKLKEKTGLEDPFIPGILRKTDEKLRRLLEKESADMLPHPEVSKSIGDCSLECLISTQDERAFISLKLITHRKYIVRDIETLVKAYKNGREYQLGKSTVRFTKASFDRQSQRILSFMDAYYKQNPDQPMFARGIYRYSSSEQREINLRGRDLDALMELIAGQTITVNDKSCVFDTNAGNIGITIEKQEYGALISAGGFEILFQTNDWLYVVKDDSISRLKCGEDEGLGALLRILADRKNVYIRDADLAGVFGRLIPEVEKQLPVAYNGLLPELYRPEIPSFKIYLDLLQGDMISCRVLACYDRIGKEYSLYDSTDMTMRNASEEAKLRQQIYGYFDAYDEIDKIMCLSCDEERLYRFVTQDIKQLGELGEVFISDGLKKLNVRVLPAVEVGIRLSAGLLHMSVTAPDMDVRELTEILSAYSHKKRYHRLKDGSFINLDPARESEWSVLSETWKQYGNGDMQDITVPLYRSMYLDEMLEGKENLKVKGNRGYKELILNMDSAMEADYKIPDSLAELLRPYQRDGYLWLKTLKKCGFGGILADDMGLGKTLQALTFLLSEKEDGKSGAELRTLIVTPASLVYNWESEIARFTPGLTCRVISGTADERKALISEYESDDADIWVTSYDLLKRDITSYRGIAFANQVIDEAQYIKNHSTQAAKAVRLVESSFRIALTGTPIENRLSELWSIFDFLMPGFLGGYKSFRENYEEAIVSAEDKTASKALRTLVHPFVLRRLKKDVLAELPDKIEKPVSIRLEGEQKKLYDAYAQRLRMFLAKQSQEEFKQSKLEVLKELTRLRQLCCGPSLFLENYHGENAKLDTCIELVRQAVDGGHKLLIFSQFTSVLDEVESALKKEGIDNYRIDGGVSKEERIRLVEAFNSDDTPVFCISLKAGGTGLNLTAADIVIHYDPWWNVAAQNQATDRAHRIGQKNTVTVYDLIAENTIEEQIRGLQLSKAELADEILSGEGISSILIDKDQILSLL